MAQRNYNNLLTLSTLCTILDVDTVNVRLVQVLSLMARRAGMKTIMVAGATSGLGLEIATQSARMLDIRLITAVSNSARRPYSDGNGSFFRPS